MTNDPSSTPLAPFTRFLLTSDVVECHRRNLQPTGLLFATFNFELDQQERNDCTPQMRGLQIWTHLKATHHSPATSKQIVQSRDARLFFYPRLHRVRDSVPLRK